MRHSHAFVLSSCILALGYVAVPLPANPGPAQQLVQEHSTPAEHLALTALRTGSAMIPASDVNRKPNTLAAVGGTSNLPDFNSDSNPSSESVNLVAVGLGLLLGAGVLRRALGIASASKPNRM